MKFVLLQHCLLPGCLAFVTEAGCQSSPLVSPVVLWLTTVMSDADRNLDLLASEEEGAAGHSAAEGRPSLVTGRDGDLQSLLAAVTTMSQKLDSIDRRSKANAKALKQPQKPKSRSEPPRKKIRKFPIRDTVSPDEDDDVRILQTPWPPSHFS